MAYSPPDSLKYETRGGTCYITMNRPQAMNALNLELQNALGEAVDEFKADNSLYVAVITGEGGRAFSAASIENNPPLAVQDIKRVVKVGSNMPLEYAVHFREKYFDVILQTEDAKEGPPHLQRSERRSGSRAKAFSDRRHWAGG